MRLAGCPPRFASRRQVGWRTPAVPVAVSVVCSVSRLLDEYYEIIIQHIDIHGCALYNISTRRSEVQDGSLLCQVQSEEGNPEPSGHHHEKRQAGHPGGLSLLRYQGVPHRRHSLGEPQAPNQELPQDLTPVTLILPFPLEGEGTNLPLPKGEGRVRAANNILR